jgi:hypothetical protein
MNFWEFHNENSKWKWKLIKNNNFLILKVKLSKIYSTKEFKMSNTWWPIWCLAISLLIYSLIIVHWLDGWKNGWMKRNYPIMNEKSSTWMKTKIKNNDVVGLNWCRTWPFAKFIHEVLELSKCLNLCVATVALGSQPRQGFARLWARKEAWESHLVLLGVQKNVREWALTLLNDSHFGSWSPKWILESLECNCRGQNLSIWSIFYIIEKLLKGRCLKWTHMTHLDIWNISYDQMKGWESN